MIKRILLEKPYLFSVFAIAFIVILIAFKNYTSETWLTGWDNLHPEFDFGLNISRSINAVWQEHQGLGLLSGMSHAADLPRQFLLYLFSFVFPAHFLRYFYLFLMLFIGPLGVLFLFRYILKHKSSQSLVFELSAFFCGLYYLLNIGTLLNFYAPIEFFNTLYGFLPWLVLFFLKYLREKKRSDLLTFAILSLFASQFAYVATLFIVYLVILFILCLFELSSNLSVQTFKRICFLLLVIFVINSYWLFPFLVFSATRSGVVINSKISKMSSENTFVINKKSGSFKNTILLKGFWLENLDMNEKGEFVPMFKEWNEHLDKPIIKFTGYFLAIFIFFGLVYSMKRSNRPSFMGFTFLFLVSLFLLMSENPPLGFLYAFIRQHSLIFREIFRFTYTKFSPMGIFSFSVMFGLGVFAVLKFISGLKIAKLRILSIVFSLFLVSYLLFFMLPAFKGYFFYPRLRLKIPSEYFEMFDWFKTQNQDERIAVFPQHTFWSWKYYRWGYRGSGFLWYGIKQPILDRAFDVWNPKNEGYYYEVSQAIYSENPVLFENVLKKYNVRWILLDKNVVSTSSDDALNYEELESMLNNQKRFTLQRSFGQNMAVYSVNDYAGAVYTVEGYKNIEVSDAYSDIDNAFLENGDYISDGRANVLYPLNSIGYEKKIEIVNTALSKDIKVSTALPDFSGYLILPNISESEKYVPAEIFVKTQNNILYVKLVYLLPEAFLNNNKIQAEIFSDEISFPHISNRNKFLLEFNGEEFLQFDNISSVYSSAGKIMLRTDSNSVSYLAQTGEKLNMSNVLSNKEVVECSEYVEDSYADRTLLENGTMTLRAKNVSGCLNADINNLVEKNTKVVRVSLDYKSAQDEKPGYCLYNANSNTCLNRKNSNYGMSKDWVRMDEFVDVGTKGTPYLEFGVVLEGYKSKIEKSIEYKNITLIQYGKLAGRTFTSKFKRQRLEISSKKGDILSFVFPKILSYNSWGIAGNKGFYNGKVANCSKNLNGTFSSNYVSDGDIKYLRYISENSNLCDFYMLTRFDHETSYLLTISHRNLKGIPLEVCFGNPLRHKCVFDSYLSSSKDWLVENFVIRNQDSGGRSYSLGFYNTALGYGVVQNDLEYALVSNFPANWLSSVSISEKENNSLIAKRENVNFRRQNEWFYTVNGARKKGLLVLGQTFDRGWMAFCGFTVCSAKHVVVNNWANGWEFDFDYTGQIRIVYAYQFLEYLGFVFSSLTHLTL